MRFIDHGAGGPPDVLRIAEGPRPTLRDGEVLIEVQYAGVNHADLWQRAGSYPPPAGASPVLGLEVAGRVAMVSPDVTTLAPGDVVCALAPGGGYAEYCAVPASHCLPIPRGLGVREAAALPETVFTVWTNVFERARLAAGETFLVHGGAGGIGLTAIQLARSRGARVFTTVGTAEKARFCERMGAEAAIVYREQDFEAEVARLTSGRGVDVILDMVGGPYIQRNLRALALDGRLVQIGFLDTSRVELDFMPVMTRRLTVTGSTLRPRTVEQKAAITREVLAHVWPLVEVGAVRPVVNAIFPLERAAGAHAMMQASQHIGKIVLEVRPD